MQIVMGRSKVQCTICKRRLNGLQQGSRLPHTRFAARSYDGRQKEEGGETGPTLTHTRPSNDISAGETGESGCRLLTEPTGDRQTTRELLCLSKLLATTTAVSYHTVLRGSLLL